MSVINLLSSKIYNRIAAGEVVERPSSVVKELVENSIDAGAKNITIEIVSGGIASIKITDDGSGIEKSQLKKALLAHATSKISSVKDLDNIITLGFRGEALASIASVSKIKIVSKPELQETGASIYCEGGNIEEIIDCGAVNGTEITVDNLFFNTPAREKFLKSVRAEESEISVTVARFIMGNPNIAFKYIADGKVLFQSFGDGFESAVAQIYGIETIKNCFYVDTIKNGLKINGYIGKQNFYKGNRSYQSIFVNGRYVVNQTISSAISNAYTPYMMKRQYPFYVLNLTLPTEIVDVNVHPNKLEVRFSNNQIIYGSIYSVLSKVLDGSQEALSIANIGLDGAQNSKEISSENTIVYATQNSNANSKMPLETYKFDSLVFSDVEQKEEKNPLNKSDNSNDIFEENKRFLEQLTKGGSANVTSTVITNTVNSNISNVAAEPISINVKVDLKYIGQALNTYLMFDDGVNLLIVDQHAAHERILYDKLINAFNSKKIELQPLLLPYTITVNSIESNFLSDNLAVLNDMGIEISEFGKNSFKVSSIPVYLTNLNLDKFFNDILNDLGELKSLRADNLMADKIAQKACKSAVKSGDKMTDLDVEVIKKAIEENPGLKCPHGRPVMVKITRTEIDKWFKRIV